MIEGPCSSLQQAKCYKKLLQMVRTVAAVALSCAAAQTEASEFGAVQESVAQYSNQSMKDECWKHASSVPRSIRKWKGRTTYHIKKLSPIMKTCSVWVVTLADTEIKKKSAQHEEGRKPCWLKLRVQITGNIHIKSETQST